LRAREQRVQRYIDAYRHYCWQVDDLAGVRLAPFHLLASEGKVHTDHTHPSTTLPNSCARRSARRWYPAR
jgi:hypothetical protein